MTESQLPEESIFLRALEIESAAERAAFVEQACSNDAPLRAGVESLLRASKKSGDLLDFSLRPAICGSDPTIDHAAKELPGTVIGPYKLLEQIGEGGMGLVYMAEQQRPMRRLVALKLIKPGMDSKQVIARFEAERQALAMMDHPNIAKVHDAGTTETGRPYFVMELVRGIPLNEFCDQKRLTVRERLQLFVQVCQAVQHAHQKGIIHRDLKPTNVLITMDDTVAFPKVIDFGIARALGQSLTDNTLHTGYSQLVGTPLYMSPEQAEMNLLGVDTRSDVYSLGVLLYELLTGTTPFDKETLTKASFDEMRRMIREDDPPRPSARMSTLKAQALSTISQQRNIDPRRISATLRGELDWIVMKTLEKNRNRRYESASALAADIQRYLSDEPVLACPPTAMYRFQKLARKHKPVLATAIAIALCLILGTTVSAWQAVRATTAEAQANANATEAQVKAQEADTQRDEAQRQRDEVKTLNDQLIAKDQQLQRTLYTAHMNLARHAWEAGATDQVVELLEQHRPKPEETDLRGFEWQYLNRLCHADLLTLKGHAGEVRSVAYSPDGKRVASAGNDQTVKVWDAQSGRQLSSLQGHTKTVTSVAFSPDGKRIASVSSAWSDRRNSNPGEIKVWNSETGRELFACGEIAGTVYNLAFSPDGRRIACGADNTTTKVWDAQSGQELLSLKGGGNSVAFSPDGKRLASAGSNATLTVWDAETGQKLRSITGGYLYVTFSPNGKHLVGAFGGSGNVFDVQTGQEIFSFQGRNPACSPDGKRLASVSKQVARVWDAETGKEILALKGHTEAIGHLTFSPDGQRLATASDDGTVKIWDTTTPQEARSFSGHARGGVLSVAYSPDSKRLASGSVDKTVIVRDVQTGQVLHTLTGHTDSIWSVAFSPDGKRLLSGSHGELRVWDVQTGKELLNVKGHNKVAFSPDGKRLISNSEDGSVKVLDSQTGQELIAFNGHGDRRALTVTFSPDSKRVASCSMDATIRVWDAQTAEEFLTLRGHTGPVESVAFSPDGKRLVSGGYNDDVKVWDSHTGQELHTLKGHTAQVGNVAFSPDGKRFATKSPDNIKLWDAQTLQELLSLGVSSGRGLAFSPDGFQLACSGPGATVKIYDATPLPEKP